LAFPANAAFRLFPCRSFGFLSSYRPLNQLRPGSSFRGVPPPQSSFAHIARPSSFDMGSPTQGLFPHRGITRSASTSREGCQAFAPFRPQVFATSRRFSPPSGFAGLFHPAATSRVVAVQGLLSPRSRDPSSRSRSPMPLSSRVLTDSRAVRSRVPALNPVSTPVEASASRLCSTRGRVACGSGISLPAARSPLRFFLLQAFNHRLGSSFPRAIRSRRFLRKLFASEFFRLLRAQLPRPP
jgi:hypothetical protein